MQWYYSKDGTQHGPVELQDLQAKIRVGEVARDALVWRDGMADWTAANAMDELASAMREMAPGGSLYAPPAAAVPGGYPPLASTRPTSGLAIASLVCGIIGLTSCMFIPGIPAIICGHMAMGRTHPVTGNQGGRGLAIAGLVMGYLCVAGLAIFAIYFFTLFGVAMSDSGF